MRSIFHNFYEIYKIAQQFYKFCFVIQQQNAWMREKNRGISGEKRQGKRGEKKKKMGQNTSKIRSKIQKNGAKI